ncbi:MAG: SOS response-associated peptidase [Pseudomonadota bacterium]
MCSRVALTSPPDAVRSLFNYRERPNFPARYNIAPTDPLAVVRLSVADKSAREFALVRWGLIPGWAKEPEKLPLMINARAETIAEKASFRAPFKYRRCLVPVDGFYEWTGPRGDKQPYLFRPADFSSGPFALAGLWEHWLGPDGSEVETATIVTRAANDDMVLYHDRMPVIVRPQDYVAWLDVGDGTATAQALDVIARAETIALEARAVNKAVGNPRADGPELHEPPDGMLL